MKRILPYLPLLLAMPLSVLTAVTTINLWQIKAPAGQGVGILYTTNNGAVVPGKINGMAVDSNGNITLTSQLVSPITSIIKVAANTPNSFPIPTGRPFCFVFRNLPQANSEDYTVVNNAIVFNTPSEVGDIVQLLCM